MSVWVSKTKFGWKKKVRWNRMIQNNTQKSGKGTFLKDREVGQVYKKSQSNVQDLVSVSER